LKNLIILPSWYIRDMTGGGGKQWINGETIAGIALVILALMFILAATMNAIWARILLADYLILAIGVGFIVLGIITMRRTNRMHSEEGHTHSY
jgi:putative Ca2+/H+ antiporter (TMEM165/GDT1 family)